MHQYDDPNKRADSEKIWSTFASLTKCKGSALMFPGPKRHEFDTAIRCGYTPNQLILVEAQKNPRSAAAVKAAFTSEFPKNDRGQLRWQTGWLSEVCYKLSETSEKLTVAHVDFCKPLGFHNSDSPAVEIEKLIKSCVMVDGLLAITVLGGREQDGTDDDEIRYRRMLSAIRLRLHVGIPRKAKEIRRGKYWNNETSNPMVWGIFQIERKL
jgi:hypothetical protein